jgi:hypothetical protein
MNLLRLLAFALFALLAAPAAARPSFDCAKASGAIEKVICADPALSADDALMARLYASAKVSPFGQANSVPAEQVQWLKDRAHCAKPDPQAWPSVGACLASYNRDRLRDLAVAALFAEPDDALAALRKVEPGAAPIYEAIWLWASAVPGAEPRERIAPLIAPYLEDPKDPEAFHLGLDMLREDGLGTADKVLESDATFASFLQHLGPYIDSDTFGLPFPCAALLRRPGLLDASAPAFASSLDNGLMRPDCSATLAPMPRLDALIDSLRKHWPECEGTIRFVYYRSFEYDVDLARIGGEPGESTPRAEPAPGASVDLVAGATYDLSLAYRRDRRLDPSAARKLAEKSIAAILSDAGSCETEESEPGSEAN